MTMHEVIVTKRDFIHVGKPRRAFDPDLMMEYEALINDRVERAKAPAEEDGPLAWYIVQTNPRCELRAQTGLIDKGFAVSLPQFKEERIVRHTNKRRLVDRMLFPRYLFVLAPFGSWPRITSTDGVQALVRDQGLIGRPVSVTQEAIDDLLKRQGGGEFDRYLDPKKGPKISRREALKRPPAFLPGTEVRIKAGPFASFIGVIVEALAGTDAKLLVSIFGGATPVDAPLAFLQAIA